MSTIFKKIIDKEIPAEIIYEDEFCLAFRDISPQAPTHFLMIPKKEIVNVAGLGDEDQSLARPHVAQDSRRSRGAGLGGWLSSCGPTCGQEGGQSVDHLHFHVLAGRQLGWPPG